MPRKKRLGRPSTGAPKRKSTSVYLIFGNEAKRKCTSVYLSANSENAYAHLKKRKGGFNLSHFVNAAIQEEARTWGWKAEEDEALLHLKKRRGGFNLSNFINTAIQEEAKLFGWIPDTVNE